MYLSQKWQTWYKRVSLLKYNMQVNVEAELEGAAGDLGRMAVWDQIQVTVRLQDGL